MREQVGSKKFGQERIKNLIVFELWPLCGCAYISNTLCLHKIKAILGHNDSESIVHSNGQERTVSDKLIVGLGVLQDETQSIFCLLKKNERKPLVGPERKGVLGS